MTLAEFRDITADLPGNTELVDDLLRPYKSAVPTTVGADLDPQTNSKRNYSYGGWYSQTTARVVVLRGGKLTF